jgi:hypothetical protein
MARRIAMARTAAARVSIRRLLGSDRPAAAASAWAATASGRNSSVRTI